MSSTVVIPPADLFPTTGTGDAVLATSPTLVTPISASLTAPASTTLTLAGGSTGASLVLGQGTTAADVTLTAKGTGSINLDAGAVTTRSVYVNSTSTLGPAFEFRKSGAILGIIGSSAQIIGGATTHLGLFAISSIRFWTNNSGTEVAQFSTGGNLLIGTTTDIAGTGGLHVAGTSTASTTTSGALRVGSNVGLSGNAGGASYFGGVGVFGPVNTGTSQYLTGAFYAGSNADNSGSYIDVALQSGATTGARLYGGRWASADRGARLVSRNSVGTEKSYLHLNAESDTAALYNSSGQGLLIASTGAATFAGAVSLSTAGTTVSIKSGTNAAAGTVTLSGGAATITSTAIDVNTVIVMSVKTSSGTIGDHTPSVKVNAGNAVITGSSSDNSTYNWIALKVN
jgi:hypothetical protein